MKKKSPLNIFVLGIGIIVFVIGAFAFWMLRTTYIDEYCRKITDQEFSGRLDENVIPTSEEQKYYGPNLTFFSLRKRQELKCENDQKFFFLF